MAVQISYIQTLVRQRLDEPTPRYWSEAELTDIIVAGIRDLWRSIVDLKSEHFLTVNETDVFLEANSPTLLGVPSNVYKVYLIETLDATEADRARGIVLNPLDYNHEHFISARNRSPLSQLDGETIHYAITGAGGPVTSPTIYVAPQVTARRALRFVYIPTLPPSLAGADLVPIPGESTNALVAWGTAYARAKEREDRAPDPGWMQIYSFEKANILEGLGVRQLQKGQTVDALFEAEWS